MAENRASGLGVTTGILSDLPLSCIAWGLLTADSPKCQENWVHYTVLCPVGPKPSSTGPVLSLSLSLLICKRGQGQFLPTALG